jgi:protein-L-isoaspartate O-methyltransferase
VTLMTLDVINSFAEDPAEEPQGDWLDAVLDGCSEAHAVVCWIDYFSEVGGLSLSNAPSVLGGSRAACQRAFYLAECAVPSQPRSVRLRARMSAASGLQLESSLPLVEEAAHAASLPPYHASMLNDTDRNAAYSDGILHAINGYKLAHGGKSPRVLDIGCGSGILSLLAASHGAASVLAVERSDVLAAAAACDVAVCGFSDIVKVICAHSRDLDESAGLFDIVVSEVFGSDALAEGVLTTLAHARSLLAPGGIFLPSALTLHAALARSGNARLHCELEVAHALLSPRRTSVHVPDCHVVLMSTAASFHIDLCAAPLPLMGRLAQVVHASSAGEADAILVWFEPRFPWCGAAAGACRICTHKRPGTRSVAPASVPGRLTVPAGVLRESPPHANADHKAAHRHWQQTLHRLPTVLQIHAGQTVQLTMSYLQDRTVLMADVVHDEWGARAACS